MGRNWRRRAKPYPRVIYGPHGASMTIDGPSEWPMGWSETPEREEIAPPTFTPDKIPLARSEIKRQLRLKGFEFKESSADAELYRRLTRG